MPIPFSFRQLEYFVAVAQQGSVTAAAAACNVSQPAVSVAVSELEAILGRTLFRRQAGHKLAITPAGRRLLRQARAILAGGASIAAAASDLEGGQIAIASFRDIGAMYLPKLLADFAREQPAIRFTLTEGDLADVRTQILDGRCDVAVTYDIGLKQHGIARTGIDRLAPYVLLSVDHPMASAHEIRLSDLADDRVVIEDFPITRDYFLGLFARGGIQVRESQFVPSFEMQRGLVANGWGVGLSCVRPKADVSYDGSRLACLPLVSSEPAQSVVLAHLGEATLSPTVKRLLRSFQGGRT